MNYQITTWSTVMMTFQQTQTFDDIKRLSARANFLSRIFCCEPDNDTVRSVLATAADVRNAQPTAIQITIEGIKDSIAVDGMAKISADHTQLFTHRDSLNAYPWGATQIECHEQCFQSFCQKHCINSQQGCCRSPIAISNMLSSLATLLIDTSTPTNDVALQQLVKSHLCPAVPLFIDGVTTHCHTEFYYGMAKLLESFMGDLHHALTKITPH